MQVAPEPSTVEMLRDSVLNISGGILDFALIFNKWMHNLHQHQIGRNRLDLWSKTTWKLQQWDNLESAPWTDSLQIICLWLCQNIVYSLILIGMSFVFVLTFHPIFDFSVWLCAYYFFVHSYLDSIAVSLFTIRE